jgi:hypothetical protein
VRRSLGVVAEEDLEDLCLLLGCGVDEVLDDPGLLAVVVVADDGEDPRLSLDVIVGGVEQMAFALELFLASLFTKSVSFPAVKH